MKELSAAATLATLVGKNFKGAVSLQAFKIYHDQLLRDSGQPTDAIEVMLIEQLMWAHHRIGDLHVQSSMADSSETTEIYNSAATRLMSEFRRTSLALREYRSAIVPTQVTVVRQQNLAAGNQQVALIDGSGQGVASGKTTDDIELVSKEALTHEAPSTFNAAADCRKAELVETEGANGRRTPAPQDSRPDQQAVGGADGPAHASGQSEVSCQRPTAAAAIDLFSGAPAARG